MKNKFFAMAFIALGLGTSVVSCTKDDVNPTDVKKAVETTKVDFAVNANNANSTTGKMTIDRNAAPAIVDEVTITAYSALGSPYNVTQSFDFGTSTATNVLPTGFFLNGVALGGNTFEAHTNGANADQRLSLGNVNLTNGATDVLAEMKKHTPYVRCYEQSKPTVTIVKGTNPTVNLTMVTDYGRILAKFVQETPDATKYIATVEPTVMAWDDDLSYVAPKTMAETVITPTLGFEWSNSDALFIYKATFKIRVYARLANGERGALLNTINKEVQISKATTKLATFTIHNTDVETNIEAGGIQLIFPTFGEEVIND